MLVYRTSMDSPRLIEFMSRVPEEAGLDNASLLQNGRLPDDGPVLANVPGTVAAMYLAVKKFGSGKVAWADIVAPAGTRCSSPISRGISRPSVTPWRAAIGDTPSTRVLRRSPAGRSSRRR